MPALPALPAKHRRRAPASVLALALALLVAGCSSGLQVSHDQVLADKAGSREQWGGAHPDLEAYRQRLGSHVVRVRCGRRSFGSAVVIAEDLLLTAGHVLEGEPIRVFAPSDLAHANGQPATKIWHDEGYDLALLRTTDPNALATLSRSGGRPLTPVPLATALPRVWEPVAALGFASRASEVGQLSLGPLLGGRELSFPADHPTRLLAGRLLARLPGYPGDSGGGVFDMRGNLVGVITSANTERALLFSHIAPWRLRQVITELAESR